VALLSLGSGSGVELPTVAVLTTPTVSDRATWAKKRKAWESPTAREGVGQLPVPAVEVHPSGEDTKVSPAGSGSETVTSWAGSGPALAAVSVNVSSPPGGGRGGARGCG